jgi:predicted HTH domain antitoxin
MAMVGFELAQAQLENGRQGFDGSGKKFIAESEGTRELKRRVGILPSAMTITIPDCVLESARMSESELRQEIALVLYEKEKITLAQASRLAEMGRLQFQHLLASRGLFINYDVEDFEQDLATLRGLGRL